MVRPTRPPSGRAASVAVVVAVAVALSCAALAGPAQAAQHDPPQTGTALGGYRVSATDSRPITDGSFSLVVPSVDCGTVSGSPNGVLQLVMAVSSGAANGVAGVIVTCPAGTAHYEAYVATHTSTGATTADRQPVSPGDTVAAAFRVDSAGVTLLAYDEDSGANVVTSAPEPTRVDDVEIGAAVFTYDGTFGALPDRIRFSHVYLDDAPLSAYPDAQVLRYQAEGGGYSFKPGLLGKQNSHGSFFGVTIRPVDN